jgi:mono/diheme cytochrome c family protein
MTSLNIRRPTVAFLVSLSVGVLSVSALAGQRPDDLETASGEALYQSACANCHGVDGRGVEPSLLAFVEEMPDFTDCHFAAREPDVDWIAVAHEGGPIRGFSEMMPAFRGALTVEQLGRVTGYIRTLCTDPNWPAGELNLPRPLIAEKAYPEDEWVIEAGVALEGDGSIDGAYVYEQRFGPRSQWEVVIPYGWKKGTGGDWVSAPGDLVLGLKHAGYHDKVAGRILSFGGEIVLPTGDETKGLGADGVKTEIFSSFGQTLASDAFVQAQVGFEVPLYEGGENRTFGRVVLGRTFTSGPWGRSFTPMIELAAKRDLESGTATKLDVVPQFQFSLNQRQHVLGNIGLLIPASNTEGRGVRFLAYVLLDWFDGGVFEGW